MRGKRSKQYRKLMQQYGLSFGFREPYQVLIDADMIRDADRFKMDLIGGLERTLQGQVKPMITQCSMRHLYAAASEPSVSFLIDKAKTYERRRCNHLPEDYPVPLSTKDCLSSVVDPKDAKTNKHRYVVASQQLEVRKHMRGIMGTPLVYINKSVMIMEPMSGATAENRTREEREKFRHGLKGRTSRILKRKREEEDNEGSQRDGEGENGEVKKKKRRRGPKEPNPLSVKKSKKRTDGEGSKATAREEKGEKGSGPVAESDSVERGIEPSRKRRRRRKHNTGGDGAGETQDVGIRNDGEE